jgi:hypothetical protein
MIWPYDGIRAILRFPPSGHAPLGARLGLRSLAAMGLRWLELGAMLQHGEHDDGEPARERNPRLAHRRSPGDVDFISCRPFSAGRGSWRRNWLGSSNGVRCLTRSWCGSLALLMRLADPRRAEYLAEIAAINGDGNREEA